LFLYQNSRLASSFNRNNEEALINDRFKARSNTLDGSSLNSNLVRKGSEKIFNFLKIIFVFPKGDSIGYRIESGYETNSIRSSSCGSYDANKCKNIIVLIFYLII
jgi:hypothetical protein